MKALVLIAIAYLFYQHFWISDAAAELNQKHNADVIMYATQWCGYCKKARVMLNMQGVKYKELDIEQSADANAEMQSLGGRGVPVFLIKGEVVKGFNQQRVLQLIADL